jgi:hypothetical protein
VVSGSDGIKNDEIAILPCLYDLSGSQDGDTQILSRIFLDNHPNERIKEKRKRPSIP